MRLRILREWAAKVLRRWSLQPPACEVSMLQKLSSFSPNPWALTIILLSSFHTSPLIWLSIFWLATSFPEVVFHTLMLFSVGLPPPVASSPFFQGHQSRAFTAPLWPLNWLMKPYLTSQTIALPSADPDAKIP
jgi:hypothetical protein